ncbi:MAG TPA: hypothetical protein PLK12_06500, partial [Prolixibacteraceae bacterium]|nr:hypothetical protein [Prolixibacteraceae bacterium]
TADIDASLTQSMNDGAGFSPIGNSVTKFTGTYNGNGKIIDNLYINRPSTDYIGLFGYLNSTSHIENLGVTDADVTGKYAGILAGSVYSSQSSITNCYATGSVTGTGGYIGGLAGWFAYGTMERCFSTADVWGSTTYSGGLAGRFQGGKAYNCYATGNVTRNSELTWGCTAGGFSGAIDVSSIISNCYSIGNVNNVESAGGFVSYYGSATVSNCYWDTETSGQSSSGAGTGLSTDEMKTYSPYYAHSWDFKGESLNGTSEIWNIGNERNNGYPYLNFQYPDDPAAFLTWDGSESTEWETSGNWNYEMVPGAGNHVVVAGATNQPEINSPQSCTDLIIESDASLTLGASGTLNVSGTLANNSEEDGLIIESDDTGTGKLVNNTAGVPATVKQYLSEDVWHYMGIPFTENHNAAEVFPGLWVTAIEEAVAENSSESGWTYLASSDPVVPGRGYSVYNDINCTFSMSGTLNTGALEMETTNSNQGWNFLANPYPCTIDWDHLKTTGISNVSDAIYVYDPAADSYASYIAGVSSGAGTQNQYIAPMQGFFVHATGAGSVTFNDADKTAEPSTFKSQSLPNLIRLVVADSKDRKDETVIRLHNKATRQFDGQLDAYKLKTTSSLTPQFYSISNGEDYSINTLPEVDENTVIPLVVMTKTEGPHVVSLSETNGFDANLPIVLKNSEGEILSPDLRTHAYRYDANGQQTITLLLAFNAASSGLKRQGSPDIFLSSANRHILVGHLGNVPAEIMVSNPNGQSIYRSKSHGDQMLIPVSIQGIYLVRVYSEKGTSYCGKVRVE